MADSNAPPHSWFAPPEGPYTLVSSLSVPTPTSLNSATAHFIQLIGAPPNAVLLPPGSDPPVFIPPPNQPCKMTLVQVQMPTLNANGGKSGGSSNPIASPMMVPGVALPSPGLNYDSSPLIGGDRGLTLDTSNTTLGNRDGGLTSGAAAGVSPSISNGTSGFSSPITTRRKPLGSSFSIPTLSSLAGGGNNQDSSYSGSSSSSSTSRPLRPFRGTSSSFVRSWEGLPLNQTQSKAIIEANQGKKAIFGFYTSGKGVVWCEIGQGRPKEAIARIMFNTTPTCVDVNQHTASHFQLDVLVGFTNGDIFWFDPFLAKYTRLNKSGVITNSAITSIQWLPPSSSYSTPESTQANLFLTSHADGTMLVWDKDREDWAGFVPTPVPNGLNLGSPGPAARGKENDSSNVNRNGNGKNEVNEWNDIVVSRPAPVLDKKGQGSTKFNPVSHWRVSKKAVNAFAFSPDLQLCAIVGDDGCLRIVNAAEEKLLDTYAGYFGALTCVAWSADGRFVVTGGQDDLCTIYAPLEQRVVARCQGHSSWVTGVAWDPWKSDERTMRFASVGEDCKLILWDLSSAALTRPKAHTSHPHSHHRKFSTSSQSQQRIESSAYLPLSPERTGPVYHPSPRRDDVSLLQPVMVKTISHDLFSNVYFLPDFLITVSRSGQIRQYDRPPEREEYGRLGLGGEFASSVVALDRRAR